jgi:hypothetical protein
MTMSRLCVLHNRRGDVIGWVTLPTRAEMDADHEWSRWGLSICPSICACSGAIPPADAAPRARRSPRRAGREAHPDNPELQRRVSVCLDKLGDAPLGAGDQAGALAAYQESLSVKRNASVARSQRPHPLWAYNLNIVSEKPANARLVGERPGEARGWRR